MNNIENGFRLAALALLVALSAAVTSSVHAEDKVSEFRVGRQPGLIYLPLYVMEDQNLLPKHCVQRGHRTDQSCAGRSRQRLGDQRNLVERQCRCRLRRRSITPLLTMWDKTRGAQKVKAISSLSNSILYLNSNDPKLKSLRDFTDQDRIALSGVGFSMQSTLLQMAAGQAFGEGKEKQLDTLTVSMPHPEGLAALLSGKIISAHFTTSPFQNIELRDSRIHRILTSTDILGGYAPAVLVFTTQGVYDAHIRICWKRSWRRRMRRMPGSRKIRKRPPNFICARNRRN